MRVSATQLTKDDKRLAQVNRQIESLQSSLQVLEEKKKQVPALEKKILELNKDIDGLKSDIVILNKEKESLLISIREENKVLTNTKAKRDRLQEEIDVANYSLSLLTENKNTIKSENSNLDIKNKELLAVIEENKKEIDTQNLHINKLSVDSNKGKAELLKIESEVQLAKDNKNKEVQSIRKEIELVNQDMTDCTNKLQSIQTNISNAGAELNKLLHQLDVQRQKNEQEKKEFDEMMEQKKEEDKKQREQLELDKSILEEKKSALQKIKKQLEKETGRVIKINV